MRLSNRFCRIKLARFPRYHFAHFHFFHAVRIESIPAVLGAGNFIRESGIGIKYVTGDPLVMFGTHPALTGRKGEVVLGKKSGKASIEYKLKELGLGNFPDEDLVAMLAAGVRQFGV